jgi:uncharacterized protein YutE (UPF0331/DUF86 family)
VAIECCIDVANHVIASEDLRFPRDDFRRFDRAIVERFGA